MKLISRENVIKALQKWNCRDSISLTINPYEVLRDIPTIEERKEGKWIFKKKARHDDWSLFMCSECGRIIDATVRDFYLHAFDFCPRCGAKMRGE